MVKKLESGSEPVTATSAAAHAEAEAIYDEIHGAADHAEESLIQDGLHPTQLKPQATTAHSEVDVNITDQQTLASDSAPEKSIEQEPSRARVRLQDMNKEERVKFIMLRAKKQRTRGLAQLERTVGSGVVSLPKVIKINDMNLGSSIERFLGVIDQAAFVINRRGEMILGEKAAETIIERMAEMADQMASQARGERARVSILIAAERELDFGEDWMEPQYLTPAFEMTVNLKSPLAVKVVNAMLAFDSAIYDMTVMLWNGKINQSQIDVLRQQERKASMSLYAFAGRSMMGLRRRVEEKSMGQKPAAINVSDAKPAVAHEESGSHFSETALEETGTS